MTDADRIINDLKLFTGTEQWYKNPLFQKFLYTDGIKYLAEKAGAYWLIDFVFSNQSILKIKEQEFQVWKIIVKNNKASIRVEDGNDFLIKAFKIDYTDFPLSEISLWFSNNVLLLPSEY